MDIKASKSILARLLAQENLIVNHDKVETASFDTQNRVLTLPIWNDMNGDLYDLLCGHEVGHALETPAEGWHDAIVDSHTKQVNTRLKGYLNVIEDARIEKKVKLRYPGLRASFYRAYAELYEKDFFGLKKHGRTVDSLNLIDRINLHFKLGSFLAVPFSEQERGIIARVENLETWAEVEALARELLDDAEDQEEQSQELPKQSSKQYSLGDVAEDDDDAVQVDDDLGDDFEYEETPSFDATSMTDEEFRDREKELLNRSSMKYEYVTIPDIDSSKFTVKYKTVMQQMKFSEKQLGFVADLSNKFKAKNDKYIGYLLKEFEMRRNAQQQLKAKVAKSGELDVKKVFSYQINDDLFRRFTTLPKGKNHGMIMYFDMSGSMSTQYSAVIEQMLVLVEFCRRAKISFEVYGFSNSASSTPYYFQNLQQRQPFVENQVHIGDNTFTLRQYFSDAMTGRDYKTQFNNMLLLAKIWSYRGRRDYDPLFDYGLPEYEGLNGTPLNPSILVAADVHARFVARTKAEVVNMVWLTDGESDDTLNYVSKVIDYRDHVNARYASVSSPASRNVVLRSARTKKEVTAKATDNKLTHALIALTREITGSNIVCFDIVNHSGNARFFANKMFAGTDGYIDANRVISERLAKEFRQNKLAVIPNTGYSEYYVIPGGRNLDIAEDSMNIEEDAGKRDIMNAFSKMQSRKQTSRVLLNRFVKMIA